MSKQDKKFTFIDLFAGCGGLSEGFLMSSKYDALAHVEWEMPMVNTLRNRLVKKWNHSEEDALKRVIHFDIQKTSELINGDWEEQTCKEYSLYNHDSIIKNVLKGLVQNQEVDLIIGGPPCQAYSIAGRAQDKNSMKDDYRNYLFESFVKVVDAFKPKVFVFENVPGLLSACPGGKMVTERIYEAFAEIGYEIRTPQSFKKSVYTASDLGVPQKRNRIIIIGVLKNTNLSLEDFYSTLDEVQKHIEPKNVRDAISHLPKFEPLDKQERVNGKNISHILKSKIRVHQHEARFHNDKDVTVFKKWVLGNMNKITTQDKIEFYNKLHGKSSNHAKYRNLEWDKPSPTIVAHLYKDGLMFIHPDEKQARSITIKEAALLQSFPDDFEFLGSQGFCFKMIGNAVPPEMAKNIGIAVANVLNKK